MAFRILKIANKVSHLSFSTFTGGTKALPRQALTNLLPQCQLALRQPYANILPYRQSIRNTSFLVTLKAEQIWKGVTSVSNAGSKRGRGKGNRRIFIKDLNRGQIIGVGKSNMVWPGLNTPIIKGKEKVEMRQLPPDPEHETKILKMRDESMVRRKRMKLDPLERGWAGHRMPGRSIGPPDPIGDESFQDFDTRVLEYKMLTRMDGLFGRVKYFSAFVVCGNRKGLASFQLSEAPDGRVALKKARNRAILGMRHVELFENRTLNHNFFAQKGRTKIFAYKKPAGFGLVCHRALKTICEAIGIKDMYAKVENNPKNIKNLTIAFFHGLHMQKTHQNIADDTGLNIVECRYDRDMYPHVVAAPTVKISEAEQAKKKKRHTYEEYLAEGRVVLKKKKWAPFYVRLPGWQKHLKKTVFKRNFENVKIQMLAEEGILTNYLHKLPYDERPHFDGIGKPSFTKPQDSTRRR